MFGITGASAAHIISFAGTFDNLMTRAEHHGHASSEYRWYARLVSSGGAPGIRVYSGVERRLRRSRGERVFERRSESERGWGPASIERGGAEDGENGSQGSGVSCRGRDDRAGGGRASHDRNSLRDRQGRAGSGDSRRGRNAHQRNTGHTVVRRVYQYQR